eukprot:TRINITY_DN814_c0_g1_i11.p1 TRINITY_DN814_c0_g1~~TRINITY_DN814_c0_g1_i11.p1  ORF type:complete len:107 (-),score=5.07 TRINITY_DN814_c0_g1_i11:368-688(-)
MEEYIRIIGQLWCITVVEKFYPVCPTVVSISGLKVGDPSHVHRCCFKFCIYISFQLYLLFAVTLSFHIWIKDFKFSGFFFKVGILELRVLFHRCFFGLSINTIPDL